MHTNSLAELLSSYRACDPAIAWAKGRSADEAAYLACPRGDWLLWILARLGLPRPQLVLAACACARTALRFVPEGEGRPQRAIEAAEAWARGAPGADLEEVQAAASVDAHAAAADAETYAAAAAAYAADAAAYAAAYAAAAAADAAAAAAADAAASDAAADAADAAADDAYYAASAAARATDARTKAQAECADLVRSIVPWEDVKTLIASRAP